MKHQHSEQSTENNSIILKKNLEKFHKIPRNAWYQNPIKITSQPIDLKLPPSYSLENFFNFFRTITA